MTELRWTQNGVPVLGLAGESGSGKTTLLEALIPRLAGRGLRVGVLKHAGHTLALDDSGRDTDRLFAAGAAVVQAQDPGQRFTRRRVGPEADWRAALADAPTDLDLLLVEGYKYAPIAKMSVGEEPSEVPETIAHVGADVDRAEAVVAEWLAETWLARPCGVLLLDSAHAASAGDLRVTVELPPVPRAAWPLSFLLAALRWLPSHAWVIAPTATDEVAEATSALSAARRPGAWLFAEPSLLLVEPQLRAGAEQLAADDAPAIADLTDLTEALGARPSDV